MNVLEKILEEIEKRVNFRKKLVEYEKKKGTVMGVARNQGALEELVVIANIIDSCVDKVKNDWILVKERLPKESGYYLVQLSKRLESEDWADRVVVLYDGESKEFMCYEKYIIAWKPLPEPCRAEDKPDWKENTMLSGGCRIN